MKKSRMLVLAVLFVICAMSLSGCVKPYDKPEYVTIEASQTAFLIPLVGDTEDQASFQSEELLAQAKVATKEVQIPHRWVKTGRQSFMGEWRAAAKLIIVERTPVTREWSSTKDSGTSATNQAIYAESKESIGFSAGMNCSAQIYTEDDAVKFLYSYNNKTLEEIMDTEIRARVETKFVEECEKYALEDIHTNKETIMNAVRKDVIDYFAEKGITITVLGMKDGLEYDDPEIQKSINEKFSSEQKIVTQNNNNEVTISKAQANAEATIIKAEAEAEANKKIAESLTPELVKKIAYDKWNGELPIVSGDSGSNIIDLGEVVKETEKEEK